jgi:hypothetical protein
MQANGSAVDAHRHGDGSATASATKGDEVGGEFERRKTAQRIAKLPPVRRRAAERD